MIYEVKVKKFVKLDEQDYDYRLSYGCSRIFKHYGPACECAEKWAKELGLSEFKDMETWKQAAGLRGAVAIYAIDTTHGCYTI